MKVWSFRLVPAAEEDANEAFDWYESQRLDLGDEFRSELYLALSRVEANPKQYPIIFGSGTRSSRLHRFPYSLIYRIEGNSIVVFAIFHDKRNPLVWQGRIG